MAIVVYGHSHIAVLCVHTCRTYQENSRDIHRGHPYVADLFLASPAIIFHSVLWLGYPAVRHHDGEMYIRAVSGCIDVLAGVETFLVPNVTDYEIPPAKNNKRQIKKGDVHISFFLFVEFFVII